MMELFPGLSVRFELNKGLEFPEPFVLWLSRSVPLSGRLSRTVAKSRGIEADIVKRHLIPNSGISGSRPATRNYNNPIQSRRTCD